MPGCLYIVATPIGHLQDITLRGLETLRCVDWIACEDTRRTIKLLNHYGISKPLVSYHRHNQNRRRDEIIGALESGKNVALVTDAGTPGISDPGAALVGEGRKRGIAVVPIPGPSAPATLLSVSGYEGPVLFYGYLPPKSAARRRTLSSLQGLEGMALLIFEGPHRLAKTLTDLQVTWGDRRIIYGREMTKVHEEYIASPITTLLAALERRPAKGEYTLLVLPPDSQ